MKEYRNGFDVLGINYRGFKKQCAFSFDMMNILMEITELSYKKLYRKMFSIAIKKRIDFDNKSVFIELIKKLGWKKNKNSDIGGKGMSILEFAMNINNNTDRFILICDNVDCFCLLLYDHGYFVLEDGIINNSIILNSILGYTIEQVYYEK